MIDQNNSKNSVDLPTWIVLLTLFAVCWGTVLTPAQCAAALKESADSSVLQQGQADPESKVDPDFQALADAFTCKEMVSCRKLAHVLGKHAHMKFLTEENYEILRNKFGEALSPTETETGYEYCWECRTSDNRCGKCCLITGFDRSIQGYNYPKIQESPVPPSTNSQSSPPGKDEPKVSPQPEKPAPSKEEIQRLTEKAEKGDADAQYQLGLLYRDGRGVTKNLKKAASLFIRAADQGYKPAQKELEEAGGK